MSFGHTSAPNKGMFFNSLGKLSLYRYRTRSVCLRTPA
jgi:hypothetical protein